MKPNWVKFVHLSEPLYQKLLIRCHFKEKILTKAISEIVKKPYFVTCEQVFLKKKFSQFESQKLSPLQ